MDITLNTTWDDVVREISSHGTDEQRTICDLATSEIDDLETTVDEFNQFMNASGCDSIEDAFLELDVIKFERDFMRLFFKCP